MLSFVWQSRRYSRYRSEMEQLVLGWSSLGKQNPAPSCFISLYHLTS
jgi:hypothetical protein